MELNGYRQIREINRGAITTVWQGERVSDSKPVLIKIFNPQWQDQPDLLKRFQREAEISAKLTHKNIIEVVEVVEEESSLAIIFPFVVGQSLASLMEVNDTLPFDIVSHISLELFKGLEYAHNAGIVHRDIKPGNVMISQKGEVLLTDFGLAKATAMQAISMHGEVVGTPAYMSPEQARSGSVGPRSDLFSLAATLYEALTGIAPFAGETIVESIEKLVSHQPEPLHRIRNDVPRWYSEMISEMLRKNASDRPTGIKELLEHPEWFVSNEASTTLGNLVQPPINERHTATSVKKGRKSPRFGLPHILAALLAVTLVFAWQMGNQKPESLTADSLNIKSITRDSSDAQLSAPMVSDENVKPANDNENRRPIITTPDVAKELKEKLVAVSTLSGEENEKQTVKPTVKEVAENAGLFLKVKPWGDIYINGTMRETSPLFSPLELAEGRYELEIRNPEYTSFRSDVIITAGKIDTMEVILQSAEGFLDLQVVPWAQIYINEEYRETTPLEKPLTLPVGTHMLRLLNPTYRSWEGKIEILPDETLQKKVSLTRE